MAAIKGFFFPTGHFNLLSLFDSAWHFYLESGMRCDSLPHSWWLSVKALYCSYKKTPPVVLSEEAVLNILSKASVSKDNRPSCSLPRQHSFVLLLRDWNCLQRRWLSKYLSFSLAETLSLHTLSFFSVFFRPHFLCSGNISFCNGWDRVMTCKRKHLMLFLPQPSAGQIKAGPSWIHLYSFFVCD